MTGAPHVQTAIVLLAKSGIAAPPRAELAALADLTAARTGIATHHAFSEQGEPGFKQVLLDLVDKGIETIAIVPVLVPMEPNFFTWVNRVTRRWQRESGREWPEIRVGRGPLAERSDLGDLVVALAEEALEGEAVIYNPDEKPEGSVVPAQSRRVLICHGAPCHNAGAAVIWGHFRNEAQRLDLRNSADLMSAKTSCLGPCALAPVMQVFPSGTYYGGLDEAAVDRVIAEDLLGGEVVEEHAYPATGKKQRLRSAG